MSIHLVLANYLIGLRERDELDALLPELLKEMGHSVLSRPQIGVAQAGVDVVSTKEDVNGVLEVFLFVIKFGDVGRGDLYSGKQAIEPSIREACNDFVRNRLPESHGPLRKRIVLLTNGINARSTRSWRWILAGAPKRTNWQRTRSTSELVSCVPPWDGRHD